ncbi:mitochondrial 54S ribosomal protein YmL19 [Cichlidogyrus casuarinus]|uniref:Mitochondrial 54S ribosomal protein YmL19 n=1 Tax=Cichlidogyrus casuarinus TaxID=1844966 RepID=A0ABD2QCH5_9PLAT
MWPEEYNKTYKPKLTADQMESYRQSSLYPKLDTSEAKPVDEKLKRIYPELVPHNVDPRYRDKLRERLERHEMLCRRKHINIPEFYVGELTSGGLLCHIET